MRIAIAVFLVAISVSAFAMEPNQAFDNLIDAMYQGDAEGVMDHMSSETLGLLDFVLAALKIEPAENMAEISEELGFEITVEELENWTTVDFVQAFITTQLFIDELPPRENLASSGFEVHGDSSIVFVEDGSQAPFRILMIKEEDIWKLDQRVIGSFMM